MEDRHQRPIFGPESPRLEPPLPEGMRHREVQLWRSLAKAFSWRFFGTIDTLILSFLTITYLGPMLGMAPTGHHAMKTAGLIAITEVATKIALYFFHERAWERLAWGLGRRNGRRIETRIRSTVKAVSWRAIASLDTIVLAFIYTGNLGTAVSIGGLEVLTKSLLYFIHERVWLWLPFGVVRRTAAEPARRHSAA